MFCTKCGKTISESDRFCRYCGTSVVQQPAKQFCPSCGTEIPAGKNFCIACGSLLGESDVPRSAEAPHQEQTALLKTYNNMYYCEGKMNGLRSKQGAVLVYENRIEIINNPAMAYWMGGALGGAIAGIVEGNRAAAGKSTRNAAVVIPYSCIVAYELGTYGLNKTIVIYTNFGKIYSIGLSNNRDEVAEIIRQRR